VKPPQLAARNIIHAQPAFASTRSQRRRCTQRTTEVQRRQLRHRKEARCQRRCPSCSDPIVCTHRRPSGSPLAELPPPATATFASALNKHHHQRTADKHHHQRTAGVRKDSLMAADARSIQLRSNSVSCVILPRLGASDAAPSFVI
jgi:hypothetical protein